MSVRARLRSTWRSLFCKEELARELDDELRHFLDSLIEKKMQEGLPREAAERAARLELGGEEQVKEKVREARLGTGLDTIAQDIRYAARTLRSNPGFVLIAILSLALGIGANTAIFSIYNGILLTGSPIADSDRFVDIYTREDESDFMAHGPSSYADYLDVREQLTDVFSDAIIYNTTMPILERSEGNEYLFGEVVSANYFEVIGVRPVLGRIFDPATDGTPGAAPTAVISHQLWQSHFEEDPDIIGRTITLTGTDFTVIGVAPSDFSGLFPMEAQVWYPITLRPLINPRSTELTYRSDRTCFVKAHLQSGITVEQARSALAVLSTRLAGTWPETNGDSELVLVPSSDVSLHPELDGLISGITLFLMAMVGLVLLIACTNLASLLLARALSRRREIGIRLAMGAGRFRLIRQLLTESILLAVAGGVAGVFLAHGLLTLLLAVRPPIPLQITLDIGLDGRVLLFALALSLLTGVIFGLLPAVQTTRPELMRALRDHYGLTIRRLRRVSVRSTLVVAQVAVSALLMVCAGLFLRSLSQASRADTGFDLRQGAVATFILHESGMTGEESHAFFGQLIEQISGLPEVESAAVTDRMPLGYGISLTRIYPQGSTPEAAAEGASTDFSRVSTGYFRTMGIPLTAGRSFTPLDQNEGEQVVIINETFARTWWPTGDALGQFVRVGETGAEPRRIVGITGNGKYRTLGEQPRPYVYFPERSDEPFIAFLVVRARGEGQALIGPVREAIRSVDRHVPLLDLTTVARHLELMIFMPRLLAGLLSGLGLFSLILGVTGLYGVISYDVSRRVREVGIRMSLGARRAQVVRLIIGDGLKLVAVGTAVGLALAWVTSGALASLLIGIGPVDPVTYVLVAMLLAGITLVATWRPARVAAAVDPVEALHRE